MQTTSTERSSPRTFPIAPLVLAVIALALVLGNLFSGGAARTWWNVITLGVIEGITEFLPISSTAHLLLASKLLGFQNNIGGTFEIFIQLGAVLAVVGYYARDLLAQARAIPTSAATRRFWLSLLVAFLPAAVIGLLLRHWIKAVLFESPTTIAFALILGGIVLTLIERVPLRVRTTEVEGTSVGQALGIGVAQVLSLVPGTSRSASSIIGGMLGGLSRPAATAFSFYLAIPTLGAATIVDLLGSLDQITTADIPRLIVGTVVAMVTAWLSIGWLLRYVAQHSWVAFGVYRIAAGTMILLLVVLGTLS